MEFILIFVQHLVRMQIQHFTFDLFLDYLKQESIDKACYYKDFFLDVIDIDSRKAENAPFFTSVPIRMEDGGAILCRDGEFTLSCDGKTYTIKKNMILCCRPGSVVSFINSDYCNISIFFHSLKLVQSAHISFKKLIPYYSNLQELICFEVNQEEANTLHQLMKTINTMIRNNEDALFYHESIMSAVYLFFYFLFSCIGEHIKESEEADIDSKDSKFLQTFLELVSNNYTQERSVNFYAQKMHISNKYLCTVIKSASKKTPSQIINQMVIKEIKQLLHYSDLSIQEISFRMNFANQSFLSKYFKRFTGMSPRQYKMSPK